MISDMKYDVNKRKKSIHDEKMIRTCMFDMVDKWPK